MAAAGRKRALTIREYYTAPEAELAYLEIPKCACTSLKSIVAGLVMDDAPQGWRVHSSFPAEFVKHDYDLDRSQYLAFTFVRHPIDRFASFYRDKVHGGWDRGIARHLEAVGIRQGMRAGEVITTLERHDPATWEKHVRPQHVFLLSDAGDLTVDYVGRLERMEEDWRRLLGLARLELELIHEHRQTHGDPIPLSRPEFQRLLDLYKRDLRLLGYPRPTLKRGEEAHGLVIGRPPQARRPPKAAPREQPRPQQRPQQPKQPKRIQPLKRPQREDDPSDELRAHLAAGSALEGLGRLDEARGAYREALDADPTHPRVGEAHAAFARVLEAQGELDGARWHREAAASAQPDGAATAPRGPVLYEATTRPDADGEYVIRPGGSGGDEVAVPPRELMEYYETADQHLSIGRANVEGMLAALRSCGFEWRTCKRVLEFGCSNGRLVRWLAPKADGREIWGVDIQSDKVMWAMEHLSPPLRFATTTTVPQLPFADRHFDLIFAGSVFTHLGELHMAWLLELSRILSPRGLLYITVHDEQAVQRALTSGLPKYARLAQEWNSSEFAEAIRSSEFGFVSTAPYGEAMLSQVLMSSDYLERTAAPALRLVGTIPRAYADFQTAYVFRPAGGEAVSAARDRARGVRR